MSAADYARARDAIASLKLNGANQALAQSWLSAWRDGRPPSWRGFQQGIALEYKPAAMFCRIVQGRSLRCVAGGAILRVALGFDITDQDLLSLTPVGERDARLGYWWQLVEGAVSVTYRQFTSKEGSSGMAQGVALPFSDKRPDGSRYFLMHTNWRPVGADWIEGNVEVEYQKTSERRLISYLAPAPDGPTLL